MSLTTKSSFLRSTALLAGAVLAFSAWSASAWHLGNRVWLDSNKNGIQDPDEPGVDGVTVNLYRCDNNQLIASQVTGASNIQYYPPRTTTSPQPGIVGGYNFDLGVPPGGPTGAHNVYIEVVLPAGYSFTTKSVGSNLDVDSDVNSSGRSDCISLDCQYADPYGCLRVDIDAGIYPTPTGGSTGTPGYWKNHPEAWCTDSIVLGGKTYTKAQAIAIMNLATSKDKTLNLAEHLIAAKLNVGCSLSNPTCVADAITAADNWLAQYPIGSGVKASSSAWSSIASTFTTLGAYNEGLLCAPHRN